ncbi:hypothetical protein C0J52_24268 [Blattella germanica]|nr:hypothetical protein C0J52_24268 [Blattella germanica]
MRKLVYTTPISSEEDLVARIVVAPRAIKDTPGVFDSIRHNIFCRCNLCLHVNGGIFEPLL